jgi:hypothetical protein
MLTSCSKDETVFRSLNATVLQKGIDCGNQFLIKFDEKLDFIENSLDNTFYEVNLTEEYKKENTRLKLEVREAISDDYPFPCTTLGISYPFVYIISATKLAE